MEIVKKIEVRGHKRLQMNWWVTTAMVFLLSGFITLVELWILPGSMRDVLRSFWRQPMLIALNWFPALVLTAVAYFLTKNVFYGAAISGSLLNILSYVNLLKTEGREDPLIPADIALIREALQSVNDYRLQMHWDKIIVIVLLAAAAVALGVFCKSVSLKLPWRLGCAALALVLLVCSVQFVYRDKKLYNSFKVPYAYNIPSVFNTLGFNYCFLYNYNLYPVDKPPGYSRGEVEGWIAAGAADPAEPAVRPNVLMVMCESFTDLSAEPMFTYSPEEQPLRGFYQVAQSDRAVSGHLVVSNYGAGTANTEFDVLTGMQSNMLSTAGATSAFRVVRKATRSVAGRLAEDGYSTFFMHPGQSWFYNRNSVYHRLGVADQIFIEAFDKDDYKGTMISDAAFLDELKADLQTRLVEADAPLFAYTVTIQNHQSYGYGKYGFEPPAPPVTVPLTDKATETLAVYFEGIRDSSAMLVELTAYLDALDEPTVLVFFGDHRPNIGTAVAELGLDYNRGQTPERIIETYAAPFVIWANRAYADAVDLSAAYAALELPENGYISDNYLGAAVLELIGQTGGDPFLDYLNEMRRVMPIFCRNDHAYCLADGSYVDTLPPELQQMQDKFWKWSYYRLK